MRQIVAPLLCLPSNQVAIPGDKLTELARSGSEHKGAVRRDVFRNALDDCRSLHHVHLLAQVPATFLPRLDQAGSPVFFQVEVPPFQSQEQRGQKLHVVGQDRGVLA